MLVVMQLKMTLEMANRIRAKTEALKQDNDEVSANNVMRACLQYGLDNYDRISDTELLKAIETFGMKRGRPTKDS